MFAPELKYLGAEKDLKKKKRYIETKSCFDKPCPVYILKSLYLSVLGEKAFRGQVQVPGEQHQQQPHK